MNKDQLGLVKVYTTPTCPFCRVVKAYLSGLGVEFEEIDLSSNEAAASWLNENLGQIGVPVTLFEGNKFVLGWQKAEIDEHLRQLKLI